MPLPFEYILPKTKDEKEFENMCIDWLEDSIKSKFVFYGRKGQKQDGIDILQSTSSTDIIAQCKNFQLKTSDIEDIIRKVEESDINFNQFYIMSSGDRDKNLQKHLNHIGRNDIIIVFWDDIEQVIAKSELLIKKYYPQLTMSNKSDDEQIIELLNYAMNRPFFQIPIMYENPLTFLEALKDTQQAFNTGKLYNRDGEIIITALPISSFTDSTLKNHAIKINSNLRKLRLLFEKSATNHDIVETGNCFCIESVKVRDKFDSIRNDIIKSYNEIIKDTDKVQLEPIDTY